MFPKYFGKCKLRQRRRRCIRKSVFIILLYALAIGLWVRDKWIMEKFNSSKSPEFEERNRIIQNENVDEFIIQVLSKYKFREVDLIAKLQEPYDEFDEEIEQDLSKIVPGLGEKGIAAVVPEAQANIAKEYIKLVGFNRLLSDMISPNRTLKDTRDELCKNISYDTLPDATVVIIFTEESFSVLLRAVHGIFNRSPPHFLREILLVDDYSNNRDLKGKLEKYLAKNFPKGKVRLVRLRKRSGLIRARMIGARLAIGDVIVFLDSHIETAEGWLEPMLQRIKENRKVITLPLMANIDPNTLEYQSNTGFSVGGFTWNGHYTWISVPSYELNHKSKEFHHLPVKSAAMAGGAFAIDRKYFWEIGSYDPEMYLWGGENLELSFRAWQCGGRLETIPCSRLGHIYKAFHPYRTLEDTDSHGFNTARLAEVWMDEYKKLYYHHRPDLNISTIGDISRRLEFRKRMKCKSFKWYLDNIYKEKFRFWLDPRTKYYGQIKNNATNQCLDNMQHKSTDNYKLEVYPCHTKLYPSQTYYLANDPQDNEKKASLLLRGELECASQRSDNEIHMSSCDNIHETWKYKDKLLIHERSGKCLTVSSENNKFNLKLKDCGSSSDPNQLWIVDNYGHDTKSKV